MATVRLGVCPHCGKERELAYLKFGVIQATLCVYCLKRYLDESVIPRLKNNNDTSTDKVMIGESDNG